MEIYLLLVCIEKKLVHKTVLTLIATLAPNPCDIVILLHFLLLNMFSVLTIWNSFSQLVRFKMHLVCKYCLKCLMVIQFVSGRSAGDVVR